MAHIQPTKPFQAAQPILAAVGAVTIAGAFIGTLFLSFDALHGIAPDIVAQSTASAIETLDNVFGTIAWIMLALGVAITGGSIVWGIRHRKLKDPNVVTAIVGGTWFLVLAGIIPFTLLVTKALAAAAIAG